MKKQFFLSAEAGTLNLGAQLARACESKHVVIFLYGNLGAGKTTLTRGFLQALGYVGKVKSPSYTLVESYYLEEKTIYHFDFYRLKDPLELEYIGIQDYFSEDAILLVEWPEQSGKLLPTPDISCYIEPQSNGRMIKIQANTNPGKIILDKLSYDNNFTK